VEIFIYKKGLDIVKEGTHMNNQDPFKDFFEKFDMDGPEHGPDILLDYPNSVINYRLGWHPYFRETNGDWYSLTLTDRTLIDCADYSMKEIYNMGPQYGRILNWFNSRKKPKETLHVINPDEIALPFYRGNFEDMGLDLFVGKNYTFFRVAEEDVDIWRLIPSSHVALGKVVKQGRHNPAVYTPPIIQTLERISIVERCSFGRTALIEDDGQFALYANDKYVGFLK
jgi:hypothetical protein